MKIKTIALARGLPRADDSGAMDYRVDKVTDSVEYHPGQRLTKKEVESLCGSTAWKVTITQLGSR